MQSDEALSPGADKAAPPQPKREDAAALRNRLLRDWVALFAVVLAVAFLLRTFVFTFAHVDGPSMLPTLVHGDRVLVSLMAYRTDTPKRGDIAVCSYFGRDQAFVKRIVGLPHETLEIKGNVVYINGKALDEPYLDDHAMQDFGPVNLRAEEYFVLGDNRAKSGDSRNPEIGPLPVDRLLGRAIAIVWPTGRIEGISPPAYAIDRR